MSAWQWVLLRWYSGTPYSRRVGHDHRRRLGVDPRRLHTVTDRHPVAEPQSLQPGGAVPRSAPLLGGLHSQVAGPLPQARSSGIGASRAARCRTLTLPVRHRGRRVAQLSGQLTAARPRLAPADGTGIGGHRLLRKKAYLTRKTRDVARSWLGCSQSLELDPTPLPACRLSGLVVLSHLSDNRLIGGMSRHPCAAVWLSQE